jgi:hypothetical protein
MPAFRVGNCFSDLMPSHWIRRAAAVGLLVTALSFPASAVNLAWNPNPETDIARYELSYGTSSGSRAVTVNAGMNTTASVTGLQAGVTYYFVVSAVNQAGLKSAPSAEISYQEPGGPSVPPIDPPPSPGSLIPTTGWTVKYASSQETEDGPDEGWAINAIDGKPDTYWCSRWTSNFAAPPHDLQIDTGTVQSIQGFRYLPRQDAYEFGNIGRYEFYVSVDGVNWGEPVVTGAFTNTKTAKDVFFTAKTGRYVQLRALTDLGNGVLYSEILACVAELNLFQGGSGPVPANQAPVAAASSVTTSEDNAVAIKINASDADGDPLGYAIVTGPGKGSLSGTAPNLTYTPSTDANGTDSFTFRANDGAENSNTATVSITITPVNDAPVAASGSVITAEDAPVSITLSASDKDSGSLTYAIVNAPGKGTLSGTAPNLSYRPNADYNGTDSFTFRVNDGAANSNTATVSITITPVNDAPVAVSGSAVTKENVPVSIVLSATDKDGGPLSYAIVAGPGKGSLAGTAPNLAYTPAAGFIGADSFSFRANDGSAFSNVSTISITVEPSPPPSNIGPSFVVNPIVMTVAEDQSLGGKLSATDPDEAAALTFVKLSGPAWLTVSPGGQLGGMPSNGDVGVNTFSVRVTDSANASASASLLVTVTNTNDAPVFTVSPINRSAGFEGVSYAGASIAETAVDPDAGDVITFSKVSGPEWLVVSETGELSGTPPAGSSGMNTFMVRATDENGATGDSVLQIHIGSSDLPLPWSVEDLAGTGGNNRASYDESSSFTLESSGRIYGSSDSGCYVWQSFRGNGMIIARVTSARSFDRSFLAGVMIRESLASNSQHVFMGVDGRGGFKWGCRTSTGGRTRIYSSGYGRTPDVWLAIARRDQTVSVYKSMDGSRWSMVGSETVELGDNCYIGLATGSGGRSTGSATFSEVKVRN